MSTIGTITFLKNTQMSRDNGIVFDFDTENARELWVDSFDSVEVPIKIKDYNGPIAVNVATSLISAATNTNYDYAKASDYTGRTYYYYVTGWKYITDDVYMCMLTLDTFMTYHAIQGTATYLPSLIERQHYPRYNYTDDYPLFSITPEPLPDCKRITTRYILDTSGSSNDIRRYIDSWYIIYYREVVNTVEVVRRYLAFKWRRDFDLTNWEVLFGLNEYVIFTAPDESTDSNILLMERLPAHPLFDSIVIDTTEKTIKIDKNNWVENNGWIRVFGYYDAIPLMDVDISAPMSNIFPVDSTLSYNSTAAAYNYLKETKIYTSQFLNVRVECGASSFAINREEYTGDIGSGLPTKINVLKYADMSLTFNFKVNYLPSLPNYVYEYVPAVNSTLPIFSSEYMSYIRTRDANLAIRNASTAISIGLSTISLIGGVALSMTGAGAPVGAAAIFASITALSGQLASAGIAGAQERQKVRDLELQGRAVVSQTTGAYSEQLTRINRFNLVSVKMNSDDLKSIALMFHITGYYAGRIEVPNITSRYSFNSLKGDIEWKMPDDKQIPLSHYLDLKERYKNGIMIIHYQDLPITQGAIDEYSRVIALCNKEK